MEIKELLEAMAKALVDNPEQISVKEVSGDSPTKVLELSASPEDIGKLIGKRGKTASAIRTIISAISSKTRQKHILEIMD